MTDKPWIGSDKAVLSEGGKEFYITPNGEVHEGNPCFESKGCKVWNGEPIENIPDYIQSWYENRRD